MSTLLINISKSKAIKEVDALIPGSGEIKSINLLNDDLHPKLSPMGVIDVVHGFSWYAGPKASAAALDKLPSVFLIEREQKISSLISGAIYYLNATAKGIVNATSSLVNKFGDVNDPTSLLGKLNAALPSNNGFLGAVEYTEGDSNLLKDHNLKSLEGIYLTEPTGFKYRLPFFENSLKANSTWGGSGSSDEGESPAKGLFNNVAGVAAAARGMVETFTSVVNITQPGVYIEKPKYFQHANEGETRTIKFPLLNTIRRSEQNPIQQNYELLWLLTFQNKPYKTTFGRTPPPKIYTVTVPGQFSMPYAYISKLDINFLGTVRRMSVHLPLLQDGKIKTQPIDVPIPEAYDVSITFTSLIGDYGNTMVSSAFNTSINNGTATIGS